MIDHISQLFEQIMKGNSIPLSVIASIILGVIVKLYRNFMGYTLGKSDDVKYNVNFIYLFIKKTGVLLISIILILAIASITLTVISSEKLLYYSRNTIQICLSLLIVSLPLLMVYFSNFKPEVYTEAFRRSKNKQTMDREKRFEELILKNQFKLFNEIIHKDKQEIIDNNSEWKQIFKLFWYDITILFRYLSPLKSLMDNRKEAILKFKQKRNKYFEKIRAINNKKYLPTHIFLLKGIFKIVFIDFMSILITSCYIINCIWGEQNPNIGTILLMILLINSYSFIVTIIKEFAIQNVKGNIH